VCVCVCVCVCVSVCVCVCACKRVFVYLASLLRRGKSGRVSRLARQGRRLLMKEIVRHSAMNVKSRVIDESAISEWCVPPRRAAAVGAGGLPRWTRVAQAVMDR
jgi:hypothetical protein